MWDILQNSWPRLKKDSFNMKKRGKCGEGSSIVLHWVRLKRDNRQMQCVKQDWILDQEEKNKDDKRYFRDTENFECVLYVE